MIADVSCADIVDVIQAYDARIRHDIVILFDLLREIWVRHFLKGFQNVLNIQMMAKSCYNYGRFRAVLRM